MTQPIRVADLAHGRSGDKGDTCNVGLVAYDEAGYQRLCRELTAERVHAHYGDLVLGTVTRYEMPGIRALNFVLTRALDGGGTMFLALGPPGQGDVRLAASDGAERAGALRCLNRSCSTGAGRWAWSP